MREMFPLYLGDLYNNYSMLSIKLEKTEDDMIKHSIHEKMKKMFPFIEKDFDETWMLRLVTINRILWNLRERLVEKEKSFQYDTEYRDLSTKYFKTNNERLQLLEMINSTNDITENHLPHEKSKC